MTALFCDLVDSTAHGERLDPEDLQALLSRYHAHVSAELQRFGGTVEKFIGDAVVALFGAPLAHEDHLAFDLNLDAALPAFAWLPLDLGRGGRSCVSRSQLARSPLDRGGNSDPRRPPRNGGGPACRDRAPTRRAYARLRAGGPHLEQALDFYRPVKATRYIREAESQLLASAQR